MRHYILKSIQRVSALFHKVIRTIALRMDSGNIKELHNKTKTKFLIIFVNYKFYFHYIFSKDVHHNAYPTVPYTQKYQLGLDIYPSVGNWLVDTCPGNQGFI